MYRDINVATFNPGSITNTAIVPLCRCLSQKFLLTGAMIIGFLRPRAKYYSSSGCRDPQLRICTRPAATIRDNILACRAFQSRYHRGPNHPD